MSENIFFLDSNVILDYLENRNKDVKNILNKMIKLKNVGSLIISTSIVNIAEVLDKEVEINFNTHCTKKRYSVDEVKKMKGDYVFYRNISGINRPKIEKKLNKFIEKSDLKIFMIPCDEKMDKLYNLLCNNCLQSQDAVIVSTAIYNESDYFISNDKQLINSLENMIYTFNLNDEKQRITFVGRVLESL